MKTTMGVLGMSISYKFSSHKHFCIFIRYYSLTCLFGHCLCVTMCNFIMYHTEIGICRKPMQIATKKRNKKTPSVRAHCVAEPDANHGRKILRRPTQGKNA